MKRPEISVCIPSYNHAPFLPETLESILTQSFQDFEIILVDDGSTDDSLRIARRFEKEHPGKIKIYSHPDNENRGISPTINLALEKSNGKYWCPCASDDILLPKAIEALKTHIDKTPDLDMVYAYTQVIDTTGKKGRLRGINISDQKNPAANMMIYNAISGVLLAKRSTMLRIEPFDESLVYSDWEYWARFLAHGKSGFLNQILGYYRHHSSNTSVGISQSQNADYVMAVMKRLEENSSSIGGLLADPLTQSLLNLHISILHYDQKEMEEMTFHIKKAYELYPFPKKDISYLGLFLKNRPRTYIRKLFAHFRTQMNGKRGWELHPHLVWITIRNWAQRMATRWTWAYRVLSKLSDQARTLFQKQGKKNT